MDGRGKLFARSIALPPMNYPQSTVGHLLPIDWHQLHQLSDGNEEFERELLQIFFVETKTRLQLLEAAIATQDYDTLQYLAHQIKGASGNVGLREMWQTAAQLEQDARRREITHSQTLLAHLVTSLLTIQAFLDSIA